MSDIYNGANSMAIDLSGYATKQELQNAVAQNGKGVFWAVYSQTSRDDIIAANLADKVVLCRENLNTGTQNIYVLLRRNADDTFDFLSILDNTQIKVDISTSGTWNKTLVPLGGDFPFEVVEFRSVPGVGWQSNKTYAEIGTLLSAGKYPLGIKYNYEPDNPGPDGVLVFKGSQEIDGVNAFLFYEGTPYFANRSPYSANQYKALDENNRVFDYLNPIVGSMYAPTPSYEPLDNQFIGVDNNSSTVFVDTAWSDIEVTITDMTPNVAANACIWFIMQGISFTSFKVYFNSQELMSPPDLSSVLNAGPGHYSLDVRGNFYTLKKIMSMT